MYVVSGMAPPYLGAGASYVFRSPNWNKAWRILATLLGLGSDVFGLGSVSGRMVVLYGTWFLSHVLVIYRIESRGMALDIYYDGLQAFL